MIRQKAISAKLDYAAVEDLEWAQAASGKPKNRLINDAIRLMAFTMEKKREWKNARFTEKESIEMNFYLQAFRKVQ